MTGSSFIVTLRNHSMPDLIITLTRLALKIAVFVMVGGAGAQTRIDLIAGWNLMGNSSAARVDVAATFGDTSKINSVWTWNKTASKWAFYAPSISSADLATYASSKNYDVLTSIPSDEGFWVNASTPASLPPVESSSAKFAKSDLQVGWNLVGDAYNQTAAQLAASLNSTMLDRKVSTFWTWNTATGKWRFYSTELAAQGGTALSSYQSSRGYENLNAITASDGVWVNVENGIASRSTPIPFFKTSYENMKGYGVSEIEFPIETAWKTYSDNPPAFGTADFFKSGNIDFFIAKGNYDLSKSAAETMADSTSYSEFAIWRVSSTGTWAKIWTAKGCLQPRKAVVADFNQDGYPDIFVACPGYDGDPFPGEKSKMVMSDGKGGYTVSDLVTTGGDGRADLALHIHGASAADMNGDGYPDLVVTTVPVSTLINQKDGTFKFDNARVTLPSVFNYFSLELVDVNGDGVVDLLAGGHEWSTVGNGPAPTVIAYGDANGNFGANGNSRVIPSVAGRGIVLDFTVVANGGKTGLYVTREVAPLV